MVFRILISDKELEEILKLKEHEDIKTQIVKLIKQRGAVDDYSFIIFEKIK